MSSLGGWWATNSFKRLILRAVLRQVSREVDWRRGPQEVARAYREAFTVPNVKGQARSVLVVAATHDEIKSITHAIRQDRQRAGELTQGELFVQHTPLNWTEAQKKQTKNYQPGQALEFHKAVKGVAKNEALEVISADKSGVTARRENGESITIATKGFVAKFAQGGSRCG